VLYFSLVIQFVDLKALYFCEHDLISSFESAAAIIDLLETPAVLWLRKSKFIATILVLQHSPVVSCIVCITIYDNVTTGVFLRESLSSLFANAVDLSVTLVQVAICFLHDFKISNSSCRLDCQGFI
jgi:hypothetical protein